MDFRKEVSDVVTAYELQEQALADARARIAFLESKVPDAPAPVEELPPLPVYPDLKAFDAAGWSRWPDNDQVKAKFNEAWMRHGLIGASWPPIQNAVIEKIGDMYNVEVRPMVVARMRDYDAICNRRCPDVTMDHTCAIVQSGDDSWETDVSDIEAMCKNYTGGLREPLSAWPRFMAKYRDILAAARPDLV